MYERSAIVLERYFENLLGFNKANNLKQNFKNYCNLFEKFSIFQEANSEEFNALSEFQSAENGIEEIQNSQEKLYKKNAKLEYNRDLIFSDITQKPDEIEKCIIKIENDISKNQATLISLREKFVEAVRIYNDKKSQLAKCKKSRKNAEKEYNISFESMKQSIENIEEEYINIAKTFATEENVENLISVMADNGKEEKIPFNNSVITNAAKFGMNILKTEVECYIEVYKMAKKLINELLEGAVSVESHQKIIRNIKVKLNFVGAEKDYLVQFLDYERITVIYGKRTHRTLMVEACEKFEIDTVQIDNLYQLLLKEIANKSTKKAYKELYNKSYLIDIEEKDAKFKKEKNKMNLPVGTIMNSNYWRIEGIKNIYTVFYKDVSEVFGKDLVEFDVPKEQDSIEQECFKEEIVELENIEPVSVKEEIAESENIEQVSVKEEIAESENIEQVSVKEEIVETENIEKVNTTIVKESEIASEQEIEIQNFNEEVVEEVDVEKYSSNKGKTKKIKRYTRKITPKDESIVEENSPKEVKKESIVAFEKEETKIENKISKNEKKQEKSKRKELKETSLFENITQEEEEYDIFGDKYEEIEKQIAELDDIEDYTSIEDTPYEKDDVPFEEESIFGDIENEHYEELNLKKRITSKKDKNKKVGIFNKIKKLNSKEKKQVNS